MGSGLPRMRTGRGASHFSTPESSTRHGFLASPPDQLTRWVWGKGLGICVSENPQGRWASPGAQEQKGEVSPQSVLNFLLCNQAT